MHEIASRLDPIPRPLSRNNTLQSLLCQRLLKPFIRAEFEEARKQTGEGLLKVGKQLEEALTGPQDVEGCICAGQVWIVQARPQP